MRCGPMQPNRIEYRKQISDMGPLRFAEQRHEFPRAYTVPVDLPSINWPCRHLMASKGERRWIASSW